MITAVTVGGPEGAGERATRDHLAPRQRRDGPHSNYLTHVSRLCMQTATGNRETALKQTCVRRGRVLQGIGKDGGHTPRPSVLNPARNDLCRPFTASGNRIPGVDDADQSRCVGMIFAGPARSQHVTHVKPFPVAPELRLQFSTGANAWDAEKLSNRSRK